MMLTIGLLQCVHIAMYTIPEAVYTHIKEMVWLDMVEIWQVYIIHELIVCNINNLYVYIMAVT